MQSRGYKIPQARGLSAEFFRELWAFRSMIWILARRDLVVRYKNTFFGLAWYILQPLSMAAVFTLFLGSVLKKDIGDMPYAVFAYAGLLLWQLFSRALTLGGTSLGMFASILNKTYFPRIMAPASYVFGAIFDFMVSSSVLVGMLIYYMIPLRWDILLLPLLLLLVLAFAMGCACILSTIDARYRDVRHAIPLLLQVWMFCTPVVYPVGMIPEQYAFLYQLNPMVGLTEWFRWLLFHVGTEPSVQQVVMPAAISVVTFVVGVLVFQRTQGNLVDTL